MRFVHRLVLIAAAALLPSCGADHMDDDSSELAGDLGVARSELTRHQDAVSGMSSVEQLPPETMRHDAAMDDVLGHMSGMMDGMGHCSGPAPYEMQESMDGMHIEMSMYTRTLVSIDSLEAARPTVALHVRAMRDMLDTMHSHLGSGSCSMWW